MKKLLSILLGLTFIITSKAQVSSQLSNLFQLQDRVFAKYKNATKDYGVSAELNRLQTLNTNLINNSNLLNDATFVSEYSSLLGFVTPANFSNAINSISSEVNSYKQTTNYDNLSQKEKIALCTSESTLWLSGITNYASPECRDSKGYKNCVVGVYAGTNVCIFGCSALIIPWIVAGCGISCIVGQIAGSNACDASYCAPIVSQ